MAFSKTNAAVAPAAPAPTLPGETVIDPVAVAAAVKAATTSEVKAATPRTAQGAEDKKIKGQVAMHAIIAGYNAASRLVLTLAPKPTESEDMLHTLAAKIAAKIEAYSFHD